MKKEEFLSFKKEWDSLLGRSKQSSTFLCHGWLQTVLEAWWNGGDIHVILFYRDDELIAAAPMVIKRTFFHFLPVRAMYMLDCPESPFQNIIIDKNENLIDVCSALVKYLSTEKKVWDIIILNKLIDDENIVDTLYTTCLKAGFNTILRPSLQSPVVKIDKSWEDFYVSTSQRFKKRMRYNRNKLKKAGSIVIEELVDLEGILKILPEIFDVGDKSWKGEMGKGIGSTAESRHFFMNIPKMLAPFAETRVWCLRLEGELVAFEYHIRQMDYVYALRGEFNEQYKDLSPGAYLDFEIVKQMFESTKEYHLCGNADNYKLYWTSELKSHYDILMFNNNTKGVLARLLEKRVKPIAKRFLTKISPSGGSNQERKQAGNPA